MLLPSVIVPTTNCPLRSLEAAAYDRAALLDVLEDSRQACVPLNGEWQVLHMLAHHHVPTEACVRKGLHRLAMHHLDSHVTPQVYIWHMSCVSGRVMSSRVISVVVGLRFCVLKTLKQGRVRCRHSLNLVEQPIPLYEERARSTCFSLPLPPKQGITVVHMTLSRSTS